MQQEELVGRTLGHYKLKRQIGFGGTATVFLADDIHLGREVALKIFWPRPGETQDFLRRFIREARVLAQLDHPNILPVYDYGEEGEMAFLVVPYMAGGSLKELLQTRKALPPSEAIQLISQVLPALQYAHDKNLIHRDIKPGNVLFKSDGSVVLADFGLVKVLEGDEREGISLLTISETGLNIAGTPEYMSPEQIDGRAVPASDIYSLGVVLYEMVTGVRPFVSTTLLSMLMKHANEAVRPPREFNPYVSPQLEAAILKTLEKDPNKRFAHPTDFLQALQQSSNPASNPGIAGLSPQANTTPNPTSNAGLPARGAYDQTILTSWAQGSPHISQNVQPRGSGYPNLSAQPYTPNTPGAPTIANSQPGFANGQQPQGQLQRPTGQPGTSQSGNPAMPPSAGQSGQQVGQPGQAWAALQTIAPPFVPQQPRRSRTPLIALLVLCILLAGVVASLFLTPLGPMLFDQRVPATQIPGGTTTIPGGITQTGRGVHTAIPGGAQALSATSTDCPANNAARASVIAPLTPGNDPTIVSIVDETDASGNPTNGELKLFDTVNGKKNELATIGQADITEAQISDDGQWVLFSVLVSGQSELRLVRLDGQGMQTLLCAPTGMTIKNSQWSIDQRYVIFDEFPQSGEPTVYLLNTQTGALQVEITPPASGTALVARTWLDNKRVLMVSITPNLGTLPQSMSILSIGNGANQSPANITPVFTPTQPCWDADSSYDGQTLFITQCTAGTPTGSSTLSKQAATGGALSTIMNSSTLAFTTVRVVDPASNTLLALASNTSQGNAGSQQNDGLYVVQTNGSGSPLRLTSTPAHTTATLNTFSQYFWSNISRDHTMYALETVKPQSNGSTYTLSYGQMSGGSPSTFTEYNQYMAIVGWTTI